MNKIVVSLCLLTLSNMTHAKVSQFDEPRIRGLRMDRCLSWGEECNEPAAYQWCLESGYTKAIYWEIENNIANRQPTRMLSSNQVCDKKNCDAFKLIVCYKR
jgi:hypothetical protein